MNQKQKPKIEYGPDTPITPEMLHQLIKDTVINSAPQMSKEEKIQLAKVLTKIFEYGMTPKEAMKITDPDVAQIYSYAYQLFTKGQFAEAREVFKLLLMLIPNEAGFATSLGACYHHQQNYEGALDAYMRAYNINPMDPVPLFFAYDCYVALKDLPAAVIMLNNVISLAGDSEKYAKAKERAKLMLEGLEKQMPQQIKKE